MGSRTIRMLLSVAVPVLLLSQTRVDSPPPGESLPRAEIPNDRILGVIPNFGTVSDPTRPYIPLRIRDKWRLFAKETLDPFTFASAAAGAGISQAHRDDPQYGVGFKACAQRFGAAQADLTTQNFFRDAVLASLLHEDPRYFRKGPGRPVLPRAFYAMSRILITTRDSGRSGFNFSGVIGTGLGIGLSNAYYPPVSVNAREMESRLLTSFVGAALGNLLPEFWPDIRNKIARHKHAPAISHDEQRKDDQKRDDRKK